MENDNFQYSLAIPVPMGEKVYTFYTDCCDACSVNRNEKNAHLMHCAYDAPCHTKLHSIVEEILTYDNLKRIVNNWGSTTFATQAEAEMAANALINTHRTTMRENGFEIANDGTLRRD